MKALEKALTALIMLMILSSVSAADTLKIHLTYKHRLDKEGHTQGYVTVSQKFFTPEQQLFREINYNEVSGQIKDYTFYFYKEGELFTEECYSQKDSLMYILKHEYDASGRVKETVRLEPRSGSLEATGKTVKSYDKSGRIFKEKKYVGTKAGSLFKFTYDKNGNLLAESRKYKPVSNNYLKEEKCSYSYMPDKKLQRVVITGRDVSGKTFQRDETYSYDDEGNLSTVTVAGNDMPDGLVKTYKYFGPGFLSLYKESNAAGIFSLILEYDYKKHFMEKGTQVSYFVTGK